MNFSTIILALLICFTVTTSSAQQYITEKMVELSTSNEAVKEYFKLQPTIFIRSNEWCNEENCRIGVLNTSKVLILLTDEDLELRKYDKWMEFGLIKRNGNEAVVKIRFHKGNSKTLKYIRKRGRWKLKTPKK